MCVEKSQKFVGQECPDGARQGGDWFCRLAFARAWVVSGHGHHRQRPGFRQIRRHSRHFTLQVSRVKLTFNKGHRSDSFPSLRRLPSTRFSRLLFALLSYQDVKKHAEDI